MKQQLPELGASCSAGRPLGELVQFLDSLRRPIKASAREAGPYPYFGANGQVDSVAGFLFDEKLVLLAEDGGYFDDPNRPISYLVDGKCWVNNHAHVLRVGQMLVPEYLNYQLAYADVKPYLSGTTRAKLTKSDASRIPIVCPPLPEQRRIVDLLTRAEGIVRLRREAAAKAAELIPALFIHHFGDLATNPMGWPVTTLGAVAAVQGGLQVTRARSEHPLERPYLRVANVYRDRLDLAEVKSIRLTDAELNRTRLQVGDLLFVEGHGNPAEVGRVAVWDGSIEDCTHQNHLIRARPDRARLLPEFACTLLNSQGGRQSLLRSGKTTSGLSTISTQNVKDAAVFLPPLAQQAAFVQRIEDVASIQRQQITALAKAQATFDALLAQAFAPA